MLFLRSNVLATYLINNELESLFGAVKILCFQISLRRRIFYVKNQNKK